MLLCRASFSFPNMQPPSPQPQLLFYYHRGSHVPPGPNIMYAMNRTATIALPMSIIVCLSTATSLNPNRNSLSLIPP
jgi:hypothetical protein